MSNHTKIKQNRICLNYDYCNREHKQQQIYHDSMQVLQKRTQCKLQVKGVDRSFKNKHLQKQTLVAFIS